MPNPAVRRFRARGSREGVGRNGRECKYSVSWEAKSRPDSDCKLFQQSSVSSDVLSELESSRLLLTGHHPAGPSLAASDHHNPAFGNEVALPILFDIVSNFGSRGDNVRFVYNGSANFATPADFRPIHNHRAFDLAVTMNSDIAAHDAVLDHAAANNGSLRDNGVQGHTLAIMPGKDELGRRIAKVRGSKWPAAVI